jgi:hypothetical protein
MSNENDNLTAPKTVFNLNWLRESSPGHLDSDLGTTVPANRLELALMGLASIPANESTNAGALEISHILGALQSLDRAQSLPKWLSWRLTDFFGPLHTDERVRAARNNFATLSETCDRIRRAAGSAPRVDLHLPYFSRKDWQERFQNLQQMRFVDRYGWIQAEQNSDPLSMREVVRRVAVGVFQPHTSDHDSGFVFQCHRTLRHPWAGPLTDRWGCSIPFGSDICKLELRLDGLATEAWRRAPRLHHGKHHQVWARVALAIQWILRRWSQALHFSSPGGLEDLESSFQVLLFNCLRPWAENSRCELGYDLLNESFVRGQFRKASSRLEDALIDVANHLDACGQPALASSYRGEDPTLLAARIAERGFRGKTVRNMLASENGLVSALMRFSQNVRATETPRSIRLAADALVTAFDEYLPRIFRRASTTEYISTAIFLEACEALNTGLGGPPLLDVKAETGDGAVYRREVRTSRMRPCGPFIARL